MASPATRRVQAENFVRNRIWWMWCGEQAGASFCSEMEVRRGASLPLSPSSLSSNSTSDAPAADLSSRDVNDNKSANPRYKTEICRNFKERSECIYGDQCQFAHGRRELRDVLRNSKYKTKPCQKYWMAGYCAYGPRCNFLHNEDLLDEDMARFNPASCKKVCDTSTSSSVVTAAAAAAVKRRSSVDTMLNLSAPSVHLDDFLDVRTKLCFENHDRPISRTRSEAPLQYLSEWPQLPDLKSKS